METTIQPLTDEQKTNLRTLAAAMRAGAAIRPQTRGVLFDHKWVASGTKAYCSCALGAAWEGSHPFFSVEDWVAKRESPTESIAGLVDVEQYFSLRPPIECINPAKGWKHDVEGVIIDLNDQRNWTRERIADWLDTLSGYNTELDFYFGMPIKNWPDSLRNTMNRVKPGSGDGIAETILSWLQAGKIELGADLKPI